MPVEYYKGNVNTASDKKAILSTVFQSSTAIFKLTFLPLQVLHILTASAHL